VAVIELLVKPGDTIKVEQSLITVESDKASMEIPSSHAGVVRELQGQAGRQGQRGHVVLTLEAAGPFQSLQAAHPPAARSQRHAAQRLL
jgi:pyruvate/2-oxoglutarate dehydrogenase complex dihydrolipoamide acyltransferase (E2) component